MGEMNTQARSLSREGRVVTLVDPEKKTAALNERQQSVLIFGLFQRAIEVPKITAAAIEDRSEVDALWKDFVLSSNVLCMASSDCRSPLLRLLFKLRV